MKNLKYSFIAIATLFLIIGCEYEPKVFDGNGDLTLVQFSRSTYDLEIIIDATGELNIPVQSSTVSSTDRTFNVNVVNDGTTAITGSYSVPTSVTIPANEYEGTLTISGNDVAGVDTNAETLIIELEEGADFASGGNAIISVFQICPVPDTFMIGDYTITDLAGVIGPGNGTENFESGTVTLSASSATGRSFSVAMLPGFRPTPGDVTINLICGNFILAETGPNPGIGCSAADIRFGAATTPTSYPLDFSDDSLFIVTYDEDILGSCGGPFPDQSFLLQKI
ncbi:hypothetical protein [Nonlabens sp. SY33080]|uniref:hypothetical protein n=1 Tax=Nonlabens sp. SY33080 TaxID=2719911 RepID=UPI001428A08C|nr:hypothetical protein [Nonlabens sp. SY33080]